MMDKKLIGIDLGGTTIKFAILTVDGIIQQKWSVQTNILDEGTHIIDDIVASINHRLALYHMQPEEFIGIGMGTPGSVDIEKGTVIGAYNLNWNTLQFVKKQVEEETGISFMLDNDANVAVLGEDWMGAGKNSKDVVFITLGTGVGGGIIAQGQLIHGTKGCAGEIGHVTVDPNGFKCTCGKRGCLETVSSATGIVRVARQLSEEYVGNSSLKKAIDEGQAVTSKNVFNYAELENDPLALKVVDRVCYFLGLALGNIGNTLNPNSIIIGGGVSAAGEFLRSRIQTYFDRFTFPQVRESTKLKLAQLGNEAGVIGAASLALNYLEN